jgi:hypothetical protein
MRFRFLYLCCLVSVAALGRAQPLCSVVPNVCTVPKPREVEALNHINLSCHTSWRLPVFRSGSYHPSQRLDLPFPFLWQTSSKRTNYSHFRLSRWLTADALLLHYLAASSVSERVNDELESIFKEADVALSRCYPAVFLQVLRKITKDLSQG